MEKTITLTLPESLGDFVAAQATKEGFAGPPDYILHLLRWMQKNHLEEKVERLLQVGFDSGFSPMTAEDWGRLRAKIAAKGHEQEN